jgi:acetoacetyl-CoA synthetase
MPENPGNRILWRPPAATANQTQLAAFLDQASATWAPGADDYPALWSASVDRPDGFWGALWSFCDVIAEGDASVVVENPDCMPGARWFPNTRLNFAENLMRHGCGPDTGRTALVFRGENGDRLALTYAELGAQVGRCAAAFRAAGIQPGDRVAGILPNRPEAVIAMLAAASLGAIWSSCSPDFGHGGILDRFGQIRPRILIACDGYYYAGKTIDLTARLAGVMEALDSVERLVIVPWIGGDHGSLPRATRWSDFLPATGDPEYRRLPFDHPLYILYSSGTTGKPKCIVHGAGGTLLQHLKEHRLHTDLGPGDTIFYFTTCGWMMWNWLVSGLASGATLLLYDGSPFHPGPESLWRIAEEEGVTVFGTSAKYLSALEKSGYRPGDHSDLPGLRTILSTGSPLLPSGFDFVYDAVKADVQLSSISGGTDIVSCFALGAPILPVRRGELQCRGLGMAVAAFDDQGRSLVGEPGELVCTRPFPAMPVGFWEDPGDARYHAAYFERFPGVWHHGDWTLITPDGGVIIYGRSDAVLNPGGVRIGTAEIYRQVEKLDEIVESIAVGQDWSGDQRIVLFVRLRDGVTLGENLRSRIRSAIREHTSPRHVPAKIIAVTDIPRTLSGKIVELAVRDVIHGRPVRNTDALANPEALDLYRDLPELAGD